MKKRAPENDVPASSRIDARIAELGDWRGAMLARIRSLIRAADPDVIEEWKWRGVPVWSHGGMLCTGEIYQSIVKLTFAKGASLPDPVGLFNAGLDGNTRRAIDLCEQSANGVVVDRVRTDTCLVDRSIRSCVTTAAVFACFPFLCSHVRHDPRPQS